MHRPGSKPLPDLLPFDLANDEEAVALATKIAEATGRGVVVTNANGDIIRVVPGPKQAEYGTICPPEHVAIMPKYFFNVYNGSDTYLDEIGEDLSDRYAAWREATTSAAESLKDLDGKLKPGTEWRMEVLDESGNRIYCLTVDAYSES